MRRDRLGLRGDMRRGKHEHNHGNPPSTTGATLYEILLHTRQRTVNSLYRSHSLRKLPVSRTYTLIDVCYLNDEHTTYDLCSGGPK